MPNPVEVLRSVWKLTDGILGVRVSAADALRRPIALRHPFVFYLGHLPAFTWMQVRHALPDVASVDEDWELLFSRGIDPSVDDPSKCHDHPPVPTVWPAWSEVARFRDAVRAAFAKLCHRLPGSVLRIIAEHDLMHVETLCYMLAQDARDKPVISGKQFAAPYGDVLKLNGAVQEYNAESGEEEKWVRVDGGTFQLDSNQGIIETFDGFSWDNEIGRATQAVPAFVVAKHAVSVGEFGRFIAAGGYQREDLWKPADWAWIRRERKMHPSSLQLHADKWCVLTVDGPVADVEAWPVYASLAEARAYARWAGARLPTEAEWHAYHPHVVDGAARGWELTTTEFAPFDGFKPMASYPEYSSDFFDGDHFVLKGASTVTHSLLRRRSFRNFYQPRYSYVFAKFRLVRDG